MLRKGETQEEQIQKLKEIIERLELTIKNHRLKEKLNGKQI
jgi:hypothetical protein